MSDQEYFSRPAFQADSPVGQYAGAWRRMGSVVIDTLILSISSIILGIVFSNDTSLAMKTQALITAVYYIYLISSESKGTVGNHVLKIEVVNKEGNRITLLQSIARYALFMLPGLLMYPLLLKPELTTAFEQLSSFRGNRAAVQAFLQSEQGMVITKFYAAAAFSGFIYIIWLAPILFSQTKTGLHDKIAGTRVVRKA